MSSLRQLGRYRIEAYRGSRGEAEEYQAFDMIRKRMVLLLTIKPETAANETRLRHIQHAAASAAELIHPRIDWAWETGEEDGVHYVAARFVNGPSLRERLDRMGRLSWEEAAQIFGQLSHGLEYLHGQGRVHGALRPENILLGVEVGAVLGGLAIPEAPLTLADLETAPEGTQSVELQAGPGGEAGAEAPIDAISTAPRLPLRFAAAPYTAPEVWMGEAPSQFSDQFALACVLAEMLSGKPLFAGASAAAICEKVLEKPELPAAWPPGTPWQIEPVLERALSQQPAERYTSMAEFAAAPERMAALPAGDEAERQQREVQRQARLEAEAQARRQAEEAARLAALERARREIEAQIQKPLEPAPEAAAAVSAAVLPEAAGAAAAANAAADDAAVDDAAAEAAAADARRRRAARLQSASTPAPKRRRWPVWLALGALALALLWAWSSGILAGGGGVSTPTASAASPSPAVTQPVVAPPIDTPTFTASATATARPSPTATRKPTATLTRTPAPSATATFSPTPTLRPTNTKAPTRQPRDN